MANLAELHFAIHSVTARWIWEHVYVCGSGYRTHCPVHGQETPGVKLADTYDRCTCPVEVVACPNTASDEVYLHDLALAEKLGAQLVVFEYGSE